MSDIMTPIPFPNLMNWIKKEYEQGSVFGLKQFYKANHSNEYELFDKKIETPYGPAAGPHTQLAQNIIVAYLEGARFFELKTVQTLDGKDLHVSKPCIIAQDECYNCEWSTELYVSQALEEYIKAWVALNILSKEYNLGRTDGFIFNMSVGYDLEGIKSEKINSFIENLKNATQTSIFKECKDWLKQNLKQFKNKNKNDIENISANICNSITLSTLHGCPKEEIEKIASYLIEKKKLNTFIKCNPTLLGYKDARHILDELGYDYIQFGELHFVNDLQFDDAVLMIKRLKEKAAQNNVEFGVKLTNTFPVDVKADELPSEEMYMSGKALFPLSMEVANRLSKQFDGDLRISYSGGADYFNIKKILDTGIGPITLATTILKPGGYKRLIQIAKTFDNTKINANKKIDINKLQTLINSIKNDPHIKKDIKPLPMNKINKKVPLFNCFIAPCKNACPIHQDVTTYMRLSGENKFDEAFEVIIEKNPLPFITGTICSHFCMNKCTRNFYEKWVEIRATKLLVAKNAYSKAIKKIIPPKKDPNKKIAIVGGGPAGLSAAYFLARAGADVTIFEKEQELGGLVKYVIPHFRIDDKDIKNDIELIKKYGVNVVTNKEIKDIKELSGFSDIIFAVGAYVSPKANIASDKKINDAISFLREFKDKKGRLFLGKNVAVIGGGNTAMDTAIAAKKVKGVENVYIVYRRNIKNMPAEWPEIESALKEGIVIKQMLIPIKFENNELTCKVTKFSDKIKRNIVQTDEIKKLQIDTVISSIGQKVPTEFFKKMGLEVDDKGYVVYNPETYQTKKNIYVIGDAFGGAASIVEAIRDATIVAEQIIGKELVREMDVEIPKHEIFAKKGILKENEINKESERCLACNKVCENCVDVCPNRANVSLDIGEEMNQILHIDYMCNECGNCKMFCPYDSSPYKEKLTLFRNEADMLDSKNEGFFIDSNKCKVRLEGKIFEWNEQYENAYPLLAKLLKKIKENYNYILL